MGKMRIKKGDRVKVVSGKDKGKEGKILRSMPKGDMLVIEGVNVATKHVKPSQKNPQAGIIKQECPIHSCKVMLVCPSCGKATRVRRAYLEDGRKVRLCKKCGEVVDQV